MFQNLGAGDISVLIDVTHHKNGDALGFAQLHHGHGAVLDLGNAAGRGIVFLIVHGLYGVHDQNVRLGLFHGLRHIGKPGLRENKQFLRRYPQPLCPELQLPLAFLSGNIQYPTLRTQLRADLQKQRGLADARSAAHQDQ